MARPRCAGCNQRGAHLSAREFAIEPDAVAKSNPADAPIMILGLTSKKYDKDKMYDEASTVMVQKLSQIQGVGR